MTALDAWDGTHYAGCESEFIAEAGAYTPCRCASRQMLHKAAWGVLDAPDFTPRYQIWRGRLHAALVDLGIANPFDGLVIPDDELKEGATSDGE